MNDQTHHKLDTAINAVKQDTPAAADVKAAAERVRRALAQENLSSQKDNPTQQRDLNTLDDYIATIPDYLAKRLTPAQTLLFEEESRESIPLRRALNQARYAAQKEARESAAKPRRMSWFLSAAATIFIAVAFSILYPQLPSLDQSQLAQVESVNGSLYQVLDGRLQALQSGTWINGKQEIRTAHNTTAMLLLDDGSRIEVSPRAEVKFTRRGKGNRIDVDRGKIIVAASPQGSGTLDVATDEFVVSVTGTIFEVGHGTNGSRVSVIEGKVQVHQEGDTTNLTPGEQFASRMGKAVFGLDEEDLAWSQNADEYIAMLREISALQQALQTVLDIEPRYSTRLLNLVPEKTIVYGAIPNAPEKIAEVYQVVRDRVQQSQGLSQAFANVNMDEEFQQVEEVMAWLAEVGDALGDETVAALVLQQSDLQESVLQQNDLQQNDSALNNHQLAPVILSEVDADAFRAAVESQLQDMRAAFAAEQARLATENGDNTDGEVNTAELDIDVVFVDSPADAQPGKLSLWLHDDLLVASINKEALLEVETAINNGGSAFVNTGLYAQLVNYYQQGAEYLGGVDLETIISLTNTVDRAGNAMRAVGVHNARYLMVHHASNYDRTNFTADLLFNGQRSGAMSWLAQPSAMGSLDFFSANTAFVNAAVMRAPADVFAEIKQITESATGQTWDSIDTDNTLARELRDNLINSLGGEFAFGLDGPALPTPSWKIVLEVYDEVLLQETIQRAVDFVNQLPQANNGIAIIPDNAGTYSGYHVSFTANLQAGDTNLSTDIHFNYAYVNGYLIAAPNMALLERAINQFNSGVGILSDNQFQALLPNGGYLDVSAISYSRLASLVNDLMQNLPSTIEFSDDQQDELRDIYSNYRGGSLLTVTGEADSIRLAHSGNSLFSADLSSLLSMQSIAGILIGDKRLIEYAEQLEQMGDDSDVDVDVNF